MKQKGFALILIAITIIGYLIYSRKIVLPQKQVTQTTTVNDMPHWKIYTNSKYGISMKYPENYRFTSTGPNSYQQQLDKGQQISGTVAPSFDTINLAGDQNFSLGIFHEPMYDLIPNADGNFNGACGSQFADKTLSNKLDLLNTIKYREVQQLGNSKTNIYYCFLSGTNNLTVLSASGVSDSNIEKTSQFLKQILATLDITANWATYADIDHGFLFKYPNTWVEIKIKGRYNFSGEKLFEEPVIGLRKGIGVTIYNNAGNLSAEQFLYKLYYQIDKLPEGVTRLENSYVKNNHYTPIKVGDILGTKFDLITPPGSNGTAVWITKGKFGILLRSNPVEGGDEKFNQILSTFKFTN